MINIDLVISGACAGDWCGVKFTPIRTVTNLIAYERQIRPADQAEGGYSS